MLVVRLGSMGDIVHTLPAVAALRCALPGAHIGWVVEERWSELLCAHGTPLSGPTSPARPLVNVVHVVNTLAWRKALLARETRQEALRAIREIRDAGYQAVIDFQGAMKSALLAQFSGAPVRFGFARPRESAARLFYTRVIAAERKHIVEQNAELVKALIARNVPILSVQKQDRQGSGSHIQFPLPHDPAAEAWCDSQFGRREFAIVNPGAGWGAKCWPVERYAEVARALAGDGLQVLVNLGPKEQLGHAMESANVRPIVCSVGQLIALCRRARLMIGGDTGPLHLAAALGTPVVGIFGPTDPARTGPVGSRSAVLRSPASQTSLRHRAEPDAGLLAITAAEVIAAARSLLREAIR